MKFFHRTDPKRIDDYFPHSREIFPANHTCPNCGGSGKRLKLLPWPHLIGCPVCPLGREFIKQQTERQAFTPKNTKRWR